MLTLGLTVLVINKCYKIIQGAFSLRNEGFAYVGYLLLGVFVGLVGFGLFRHPHGTIKIAIYSICAIVLAAGLMRLIAAIAWTKKRSLRRALLLSGLAMTIVGFAALLGGIVSIYIVLYSIGVFCILRGALYGLYTTSLVLFAFIRGFDKTK